MLQRRLEKASVKPATWHDFRRTFATVLLQKQTDIKTVSKLLRHADISTTSRYLLTSKVDAQRAVQKLFFPY